MLVTQLDKLLDPKDEKFKFNVDFDNITAKGSNLLSVHLKELNITLRDSKQILPGALASHAKSFDLKLKKGQLVLPGRILLPLLKYCSFPFEMPQVKSSTSGVIDLHPINHWLNGLPPKEYYLNKSLPVNKVGMKECVNNAKFLLDFQYEELEEWYSNEYERRLKANEPFITHKERKEYCQNDVEILAQIVAKTALKEWKNYGKNPFLEALTITKYTYSLFLEYFMDENSIAIIPGMLFMRVLAISDYNLFADNGYCEGNRGSEIADKWALYMMNKHYHNSNIKYFWRRCGGGL